MMIKKELKNVDLNLHDDVIQSLNIDFNRGLVEIIVQTYSYTQIKDPEELKKLEATMKQMHSDKVYSSKKARILKITVFVAEEPYAEDDHVKINITPCGSGGEIYDALVENKMLDIQTIFGHIQIKLDNYTIEEINPIEEKK